jgi:hypothetical protein
MTLRRFDSGSGGFHSGTEWQLAKLITASMGHSASPAMTPIRDFRLPSSTPAAYMK